MKYSSSNSLFRIACYALCLVIALAIWPMGTTPAQAEGSQSIPPKSDTLPTDPPGGGSPADPTWDAITAAYQAWSLVI
jgi:hypothetical protein